VKMPRREPVRLTTFSKMDLIWVRSGQLRTCRRPRREDIILHSQLPVLVNPSFELVLGANTNPPVDSIHSLLCCTISYIRASQGSQGYG
jgi:hypothetical protein